MNLQKPPLKLVKYDQYHDIKSLSIFSIVFKLYHPKQLLLSYRQGVVKSCEDRRPNILSMSSYIEER